MLARTLYASTAQLFVAEGRQCKIILIMMDVRQQTWRGLADLPPKRGVHGYSQLTGCQALHDLQPNVLGTRQGQPAVDRSLVQQLLSAAGR